MNNNQNVGNNPPTNQTNTNQFNQTYGPNSNIENTQNINQTNINQYSQVYGQSPNMQNTQSIKEINTNQFNNQFNNQYNQNINMQSVQNTNQTNINQYNQTYGQNTQNINQVSNNQFNNQYSQTYNQNQQITQNNINEDELLLECFIGSKYYNIRNSKFNLGALFAAPLYFFYRKMTLYGILFIAIDILLTIFFKNQYTSSILFLVAAVTINNIYINFAQKKIAKIKEKNQGKTLDELKVICSNKGGTSVGLVFLGIFSTFIISFAILIPYVILTLAKNMDNINDFITNINTNINQTSTYNGTIIDDDSVNVKESYTINYIPADLKEVENNNQYEYLYHDNNNQDADCKFIMTSPKDFSSSDTLIEEMYEYHKERSIYTSTPEIITSNGITWKSFSYKNSDDGNEYYYATNSNGKVYLFRYTVGRSSSPSCELYRTEILNSIVKKEN